jgi:adenylate cyclase class 2
VYEKNIRYEDAAKQLTKSGRVLRLRQDARTRLTFKEPAESIGQALSSGISSRHEFEVTISDFETMDIILHKLGFHASWIYEKYRTTYELGECEVVLDELPMGNFVEIEGSVEAIEAAIVELELANARRIVGSYSALFFQARERLDLPMHNLTFAAFEKVTIPLAFWESIR